MCLSFPDISVLEVEFNLLNQEAALKLFPYLEKKRTGIIAKVPLARGMLTVNGKVKTGFFSYNEELNTIYKSNLEKLKNEINKNILEALHLKESDRDLRCPIQIVSTGHSKVLIGIKSHRVLDSLHPNMDVLSKISKEIKCNGYFVFTFDSNEADILTKGRMFAPAIGINEDPVTGNANGPLGAYIVQHKLINTNGKIFSFKGKQGEAIGRTGIVDVEVEIKNGFPQKVKIGGNAKIVFKTEIEI